MQHVGYLYAELVAGGDIDLIIPSAIVRDIAEVREGAKELEVDRAGDGDGGEGAEDYGDVGEAGGGGFGEELLARSGSGCDDVAERAEGLEGGLGGGAARISGGERRGSAVKVYSLLDVAEEEDMRFIGGEREVVCHCAGWVCVVCGRL